MDNTERCSRASTEILPANQERLKGKGATAIQPAPQDKLDPRRMDPLHPKPRIWIYRSRESESYPTSDKMNAKWRA